MVQVHVGEQDVVHRLRTKPQGGEGVQNHGHALVGAGIDHGNAAVMDDEVNGGQAGAQIAAIEDMDALAVVDVLGWAGHAANRVCQAMLQS